MPVPKRKTSRAVRDSRRGGNNNISAATLNECPQCHQPKLPHRVCPSCGYYKGREVVETD
jgi:large subunit ribosomal protein L32